MRRKEETVRRLAATELNVLITGHTGTGRASLARLIHEQSGRADLPLYEIEADALSAEALAGMAGGNGDGPILIGSLLLHGLERLDAAAQATLLEVVEEGTCTPPRSGQRFLVDLRILATADDVATAVAKGRLRMDLFYRLNEAMLELGSADNGDGGPSLEEVSRSVERQVETRLIRKALERHRWDRHETAEALHISYRSLCDKIKRLEIAP